MFNKEAIFVTVGVWLYENQLVFLGGYPTHWGVANMIKGDEVFLWSRGMTHLPRSYVSKQNGMKIDINTSDSLAIQTPS